MHCKNLNWGFLIKEFERVVFVFIKQLRGNTAEEIQIVRWIFKHEVVLPFNLVVVSLNDVKVIQKVSLLFQIYRLASS